MSPMNKTLMAILSVVALFGAFAVVAEDSEAADSQFAITGISQGEITSSKGTTVPAVFITLNQKVVNDANVTIKFAEGLNDFYISKSVPSLKDNTEKLGITYTGTIGNPDFTYYMHGVTLSEGASTVTMDVTSPSKYTVTYDIDVAADGKVTIKDQPVAQQYTVIITPVEGATVTVMNGEDPVNSGDKVAAGTKLTVTVKLDEGYKLAEGQKDSYEVTVDKDNFPITVKVVKDVAPGEEIEMVESKVSGVADTTTSFTERQIVVVDGSWTLTKGTVITIYGQLVVPEGSTLTVEAGARLVFDNARTDINVAEIQGTLVIAEYEEDDNGAKYYSAVALQAGTMDVTGTIDISGNMDVTGGNLVINEGATATVAKEGALSSDGSVTVKTGAVLTVNGLIAAAVDNYGTVKIDSAVPMSGLVLINQMANGAVVEVAALTVSGNGGLTVTDENLVIFTKKNDDKTTTKFTASDAGIDNAVALNVEVTEGGEDVVAEFGKLTFTTSVSSSSKGVNGYLAESKKYYTVTMDVAGTTAVSAYYVGEGDEPAKMDAKATIGFVGTNVTIANGLTVGSGVEVRNASKLTVSSDVSAVADGAKFDNYKDGSITGEISLTMTGSGHVTVKSKIALDVNATLYQTGSGKDTVYNYVTLDAALATVNAEGSTVKQLTVLGKNAVTASASLPANVTLTNNGEIAIGETNGSDVVLTIKKDADVKGSGSIDVKGTLYAENKKDIANGVKAKIESDVYSEQIGEDGKAVKNGWAKWTNLTTALAEAKAGEVVEVYRDAPDFVEIESNTTVPADVTLLVKDGKAPLKVMNGITLTVNGTLKTEMDVFAETRFATVAMDVKEGQHSSVIAVNGYLFASALVYGDGADKISAGVPVAGVYYTYDGMNAVSPLAKAVAVLDKVESDLVVKGPVTESDIAFKATESCKSIVVSDAAIAAIDGKTVSTQLTVASLTIEGASVQMVGSMTGSVVVGQASVAVSSVSGLTVADVSGKLVLTGSAASAAKSASLTVSAGEVVGKMISAVKTTVAENAVLVSEGASIDNLVIDGKVTVAADKTLTAKKVLVNGTLSVAAATSTSNAGSAKVGVLDVGIKGSSYTGAAATVEGPVEVTDIAYVSASAVLDDSAKASMPAAATEYNVKDSLWMTVYAAQAHQIGIVTKAPVENAYFAGVWNNDKGKNVNESDIGKVAAVYAEIEYNVYHIVLLADMGVENILIDGVLMTTDATNAHTATVAAGSHTITYRLANGYSGTATLMVDGVKQSGMTFTATGTPETAAGITMKLQLTGIEPSGYVPPSEPVVEEKDDGMTITDYLLIVLVVLIVILAIIVALRLMRS